jgi:hypothetical protein
MVLVKSISFNILHSTHIQPYIYVCVCVCVCTFYIVKFFMEGSDDHFVKMEL